MTKYKKRGLEDFSNLRCSFTSCRECLGRGSICVWLEILKELRLLNRKKKYRKQKPSEWNRFVSKHMKEGKSMKEVAELWRKRKK